MEKMESVFEVIVVGGGHAGVEACLAASRLGAKTLLITSDLQKIAFMSCNPSVGGLGKGHIVKEIDVLGGEMGVLADKACLMFTRLNQRKGPAVRGTRMQSDKVLYTQYALEILKNTSGLTLLESEVKELILKGSVCEGVRLKDESEVRSETTVITTGTFMKATLHMGSDVISGGRVGEKATVGLSDQLKAQGFQVNRLKTGTPPRLKKESIHWEKTQAQNGDKEFIPFSHKSESQPSLPQIQCFLSHTTEETHDIIRKNLHQSPLFTGLIQGVGPRYCPSIEDKITRFVDKTSHLTFLEPESLSTNSIYLQGISTSLPPALQLEFLKTIPGLEKVEILQPGYAVEYDFFEPEHIFPTLETKVFEGLFLAGQVNGTSGYEEAGGQGLVAGTNAALKTQNKNELLLSREESYIGVLIDDLCTKGTKEPYRMMTSRAEHRLHLREDNVIDRLFKKAREHSLISPASARFFEEFQEEKQSFLKALDQKKLVTNQKTQDILKSINTAPLLKPVTAKELLRRKEVGLNELCQLGLEAQPENAAHKAGEIEVKYEGYIKRQAELIQKAQKMTQMEIPKDMDYKKIRGLSAEEVEKLERIRPQNLGQASRISGVNPSGVQALMIYTKTSTSSGVTETALRNSST